MKDKLPELERVEVGYRWYKRKAADSADYVASTRDVFQARFARFTKEIFKKHPKLEIAGLISAVAGEIGNNSFDHNLGLWESTPGAWFDYGVDKESIWFIVADRGVGLRATLSRVSPEIKTDRDALDTAFYKVISGRAPEKRGNGLKFVRATVNTNPGMGMYYESEEADAAFGEKTALLSSEIEQIKIRANGSKKPPSGMFAWVVWSKK
jgi:hypothetical protein